jgi:hypothetical protein
VHIDAAPIQQHVLQPSQQQHLPLVTDHQTLEHHLAAPIGSAFLGDNLTIFEFAVFGFQLSSTELADLHKPINQKPRRRHARCMQDPFGCVCVGCGCVFLPLTQYSLSGFLGVGSARKPYPLLGVLDLSQ